MKKKLLASLSIGVLTFAISSAANANLIENGSFETPEVTGNNGKWQYFTSVNNWSSANDVELQTDLLFGPAADGSQYAELDSRRRDGNEWLTQTFETVASQAYEFTFAFSPRKGVSDNILGAGIVSYIGDSTGHWLTYGTHSASGVGLTSTDWSYFTYSFIADGEYATVAFKDLGRDDSYGTFIDDVSVEAVVPEPTTMLLFGTGIAGLAAVGRRKRK